MARKNKQWRHWRRHVRTLFFAVLLLGALPGLIISAATGLPWTLLLIPAGMIGALVATPITVLALALMVLSMALPVLVLGAVFGAPLYLVYRLVNGPGRTPALEDAGVTPEAVLRRRYVAGELSYAEFRGEMLTCLKGRFASGELALSQYEAELEKLMQPARHLDVARDPLVFGTLPER